MILLEMALCAAYVHLPFTVLFSLLWNHVIWNTAAPSDTGMPADTANASPWAAARDE